MPSFAVCATMLALSLGGTVGLDGWAFAATNEVPVGPIVSLTTPVRETFDVGSVHVEHFGARHGHALILIPALFCGAWQWNREINALASRYDIYAATLAGFDGRALRDTSDLMARALESFSQLVRERHLVEPVVIGHSLGGTIAVMFAERYPRDPGAVIAVEGGYPVAPTDSARAKRAEASAAPFDQATRGTLRQVLVSQILRYTITRQADTDTLAQYGARSSPRAIAAWMRAALSLDLTGRLGAIRVPLLEIVPFDSTIDPYRGFATLEAKREAYRAWVAHAPGGRVEMIAHARHFVMFDRPAAFDRALTAAIARYAAGR